MQPRDQGAVGLADQDIRGAGVVVGAARILGTPIQERRFKQRLTVGICQGSQAIRKITKHLRSPSVHRLRPDGVRIGIVLSRMEYVVLTEAAVKIGSSVVENISDHSR